MKKTKNNSIIEICPIRNIISRFGNKWALLVIYILSEDGPVRFNQLCKLIPDISTKMLSSTLRTLESDGLVSRTVFPEVPIRVEYALTDTGISLVPHIKSLTEWAIDHMHTIIKQRELSENNSKPLNKEL